MLELHFRERSETQRTDSQRAKPKTVLAHTLQDIKDLSNPHQSSVNFMYVLIKSGEN